MRREFLTTIRPGSRGEFEVRTTGAVFRLGYYRFGATLRRIPGADSRRSPYDWRSTMFFGTLDPIQVGQPPVFILSARETWSGSAVTAISLLREPCRECGGPDVLRRGRCWRCVLTPDHVAAMLRDHTNPRKKRWRNRAVGQIDRWVLAATVRAAEARQRRRAAR